MALLKGDERDDKGSYLQWWKLRIFRDVVGRGVCTVDKLDNAADVEIDLCTDSDVTRSIKSTNRNAILIPRGGTKFPFRNVAPSTTRGQLGIHEMKEETFPLFSFIASILRTCDLLSIISLF